MKEQEKAKQDKKDPQKINNILQERHDLLKKPYYN